MHTFKTSTNQTLNEMSPLTTPINIKFSIQIEDLDQRTVRVSDSPCYRSVASNTSDDLCPKNGVGHNENERFNVNGVEISLTESLRSNLDKIGTNSNVIKTDTIESLKSDVSTKDTKKHNRFALLKSSPSVIFCKDTQSKTLENKGLASVSLCNDCYLKIQKSLTAQIPSKTSNLGNKRTPLKTTITRYGNIFNYEGAEFGSDSLETFKFTPFYKLNSSYMQSLNEIALNAFPSKTYKFACVAAMHKKWLQIIFSKKTVKSDISKYSKCLRKFSESLAFRLLNSVDVSGNNILHLAFGNNRFDIAEELMKDDCTSSLIKTKNKLGYSPLAVCSVSHPKTDEDWEIVKRAVQLGNVNDSSNYLRQSPLMLAASHGPTRMVSLLLSLGADPNLQDSDGSTALMYAAAHARRDCVKSILRHRRCDATIRDHDFKLASSAAVEAGDNDLALFIYFQKYNRLIRKKNCHGS